MENERKRLRFEILLERFFGNFHRILLTNLLFAIPSTVFFAAVYFLNIKLFDGAVSLPVALLAIIPLFPFYSGVVMVCRNIARGDEKVRVVHDFLTAIKENFLRFLLHGAVIYVVITLSVLSIMMYVSMLSVSWLFYALLFFSILIALFLLYTVFYLPLMTITYDLPLKHIYKNSFLMSFGEFKNNFFATVALTIVFGICFTITAFINSVTALIITLAAMWVLLIPASVTFMIVFFIYDGMTALISSKDEVSRELTNSINKSLSEQRDKQSPVKEEEDFSDIDITTLKDTDDYIFHNGRMVKQSTILRRIREQKEKEDGSDE